jgi:hypothetical protein
LSQERQVPPSVLKAILKVETNSYMDAHGNFIYVDRSRGAAHEVGPYQITPAAFKQVYNGRSSIYRMETDFVFATKIATDYLLWLDKNYSKGDWRKGVQYYNAGPKNSSKKYLRKIEAAGGL